MTIWKRLENLYRLSEIELKKGEISLVQFRNIVDKFNETQNKPKMAQIIKMDSPIKKVLEEENV